MSRFRRRLPEYQYAAYPLTNGKWLDATQLADIRAKMEARVDKKMSLRETERQARRRRAVVIVALLAVLLVPLAYVFWRVPPERNRLTNSNKYYEDS
jgi:hypothetical protein